MPLSSGKRYHRTHPSIVASPSVGSPPGASVVMALRAPQSAVLRSTYAALVAAFAFVASPAEAAPKKKRPADRHRDGAVVDDGGSTSAYSVLANPDRPRSDIGIPLVSFILPGFDQWWEGQYGYAATYTGVAIGGYAYSSHVMQANGLNADGSSKADDDKADDEEEETRASTRRTSPFARPRSGRSSPKVPAASAPTIPSGPRCARARRTTSTSSSSTRRRRATSSWRRSSFSSWRGRAPSYRSGSAPGSCTSTSAPSRRRTWRGPLSPRPTPSSPAPTPTTPAPTKRRCSAAGLCRSCASTGAATSGPTPSQSLLFAAAHLNTNPQPLPQLLLGYHLGYVAQKNSWRLAEAVFIHVWWDVLAFATIFNYREVFPERRNGKPASPHPLAAAAGAPLLGLGRRPNAAVTHVP